MWGSCAQRGEGSVGMGVELKSNGCHNAIVMTLTVRNVPADLHELLKARARLNRRSLDQEVIAVLDEGLASQEASRAAEVARILSEIEEDRARMPQFLSAREIDESIEAGRR